MTTPTVLVTGGTGTTGSRLTSRLRDAGATARVATRRADLSDPDHVSFDWLDPSTHAKALAGVDAVYLVAPIGVLDARPVVEPFVGEARQQGVRRVVLLSSSAVTEDSGPGLGELHQVVRAVVPEWSVLRPSWFMQNFTIPPMLGADVERGEIISATGDGRVAFIDAADIAAVAAECLLADASPNADLVLTGPEALSYSEAASLLSAAVGHPVGHRAVEPAQRAAALVAAGLPADYATMLAGLEDAIAHGHEDRVTTTVERITGRPPRSFSAFVTDEVSVGEADR